MSDPMIPDTRARRRIAAAGMLLSLPFVAAGARAVVLQVSMGDRLRTRTQASVERSTRSEGKRGELRASGGEVLASTAYLDEVSADPALAEYEPPSDEVLRKAAGVLALPPEELTRALQTPGRFVPLLRRVPRAKADAIERLRVPWLAVAEAPVRLYPEHRVAAALVGFVDGRGRGAAGLELARDAELAGAPCVQRLLRDAAGRAILLDPPDACADADGSHVVLTIDLALQRIADEELETGRVACGARAGIAIVMEPSTGAVLALAHSPGFDPNEGWNAEGARLRAATDPWEPGSTMKTFTLAIALDLGVVGPDDAIPVHGGTVRVGGRLIRDDHPCGCETMPVREVLVHSSNAGAAEVGGRTGAPALAAGLRRFGFGARTGCGLPGEASGSVPRDDASAHALATASFGQGPVTATFLQLASAYAAIANGGMRMQPRVVQRVLAPDGTLVREYPPVAVERAVGARTATLVASMLADAVERGTGTAAAIENTVVAGKTGTAQIAVPGGGYSATRRLASFAGFAPLEMPRWVVVVAYDSPTRERYGGRAAAPVFRAIVERAMALPTKGAAAKGRLP